MKKFLRKLFFGTKTEMVDPDPLQVNWPAGEVVIEMEYVAALAAWSMPNSDGSMPMMGLQDRMTLRIQTHFERPVMAFSWLDAPKMAKLKSVKIDGVDMMLGELSGAVFGPRPHTFEIPRWWWRWTIRPVAWVMRPIVRIVERVARPLARAAMMYSIHDTWRR